ncbi:MAG: PSD1 and planctomycete cytochrome C domain-containing protein [Paludisphaera borealis]|uniref:PSD1 and planctomycete cytochrome C domain-containing protein n=1 Tax=Paludisphaera borealis TaxID=1387353 RepID=UPI002850CEB9|nr:PSD1 and planctomycete cytochrome C domain-containing protein [Paludisphaera borealis]MDR3619171.1 PSD1 and planctomycete cytochrome C domain-containing protein [Paludisphaera borealis]
MPHAPAPTRPAWVLAMLGGLLASANAADEPASTAFFETKIRPVLVEHCAKCHGAAIAAPKGGLRVDTRDDVRRGGDSGPGVVPGKPDESLLLQAIERTGDVAPMPPKTKLPAAVVADFRAWIAHGANDPRTPDAAKPAPATADADWWSLRPLTRPEIPNAGRDAGRNPIDAFLRVRLDAKGLKPVAEADRRTLIRRVTHDLTGLPPTPDEVAAFVADADPTAYERLVDRLLASPRYGERWARHWLDVIHFADTHGLEHDQLRPNAWRYRDYVIASFNRDVSWGRFIREQIAADALYPDQPSLTAALGFLGAGPYDRSAAGTAPKNFEYLDRDDLVTQTMSAFVSTTVNCARCHAHKFDPIPQEDYFALQAVFAGVGKGDVAFDEDDEVGRRRRTAKALLAAAETGQGAVLLRPEHQAHVIAWEQTRVPVAWRTMDAEVFTSSDGSVLERRPDGSILATGTRPDKDVTTLTLTTPMRRITGLRLEVLADDSLPAHGPGRADNGNFHLSEVAAQVFQPGADKPRSLHFRRATADWNQDQWTIAHAIDGDPATAWGVSPKLGESHHAVFELDAPLDLEPGAKLVVVLKQSHGRGHLLGRFKVSAADAPGDSLIAIPEPARTALETAPEKRTEAQRVALAAAVLRAVAESDLARLPAAVKVYAASNSAENERGIVAITTPRVIRVLRRGDLDAPGPEAAPGALSAVSSLKGRFDQVARDDEAGRRVALAEWLADDRNPLTWRSIANRVWQYHFGRGLSDAPGDFGRMGDPPSHPELLDWLAVELRDGGSMKRLHRLICTSEAYRRASAHRDDAEAVDPGDRLVWRMSRRRLEAEEFRDAVLAVSGRLDDQAGGPGSAQFKTLPGIQVTPKLDYETFDWDTPGAARRSIYRIVWRGMPDPLFDALDFPDATLMTPVRGFSASPLQALALLNNPFVLRFSAHFAARVEAVGKTTDDHVRAAFRLALLREPSTDELAAFGKLADVHSLAAVCRLLFNSNEFLFVD